MGKTYPTWSACADDASPPWSPADASSRSPRTPVSPSVHSTAAAEPANPTISQLGHPSIPPSGPATWKTCEKDTSSFDK